MWLNGTPIDPATVYNVTVNSFLASGGDGFTVLANGTNKTDTSKTDLQAMVEYMAQFGSNGSTVDPSYKQNGVNTAFPAAAPSSYSPGDHVKFDVSGWSMTNTLDTKDSAIEVKLGGTTVQTATLDNAAQAALPGFDVTGKASVDVVVPNNTPPGSLTLTLVGATTGSEFSVTVPVGKAATTTTADDVTVAYGQPVPVSVTVTGAGDTPSGTVTLLDGIAPVGTGTLDASGHVTIPVAATTLPVGDTSLVAVYGGDTTHLGSQDGLTVTTTKAASSTNAPDVNVTAGAHGTVTVTVTASGVTPTGDVAIKNGATTIATGTLSSGSVSITLPVVPDGTTLTADYPGDANVTGSSDGFTVHVGKATPTVSATDVSVQYGKAATVTVTVGAPNGLTPTGTVTIRNGGTTLGTGAVSGGKAMITLPAGSLPAGANVLTAEYGGDANLGAGTDSFTVTVSKATSKTKADVKPDNLTPKKKVKLTVEVKVVNGLEATGQVKITVGGDTVTRTLKNGELELNLGKFDQGTHKVKVVYLGTANIEGSKDTVTFTVKKK